jgi:purine-binding chemotaxis protein CheW
VEEQVKVVIFRSGSGRYAFHGRAIREILDGCEPQWAPALPPFMPGLIQVRGDIEPVIDLRYFLDGAGTAGNGQIAMAASGDFHAGILVDAVEEVADLPADAIQPAPDGAGPDLAEEGFQRGDAWIPLIDLARLAAKAAF